MISNFLLTLEFKEQPISFIFKNYAKIHANKSTVLKGNPFPNYRQDSGVKTIIVKASMIDSSFFIIRNKNN
jgi:hypothetical protein